MDIIQKIRLIERLDYLIRRRATGSPKELSSKLELSERQVYNIIHDMKIMGAPIMFCSVRKSYCYEEKVVFKFGFLLEEDAIINDLKGGIKSFYNSDVHQDFLVNTRLLY
jgi:hypothetical protein